MGQLTVRKVDAEIIRRLKIRAAEHGRSAEAEHREILKQALLPNRKMDVDEWLRYAKEVRERTNRADCDRQYRNHSEDAG